MSEITAQTVYELMLRIENRLNTIERTLTEVKGRQDSSEGEKRALVWAIRWLGPTGCVALVWAIAKGAGLV